MSGSWNTKWEKSSCHCRKPYFIHPPQFWIFLMTQLHYVTILKDVRAWRELVLRWHRTKIPAYCLFVSCHKNLAITYIIFTRTACIANSTHICKFVQLENHTWFEHYDTSSKPSKYFFHPFLIETNSIFTVSGKNKLSCFIASVQTSNTFRVKNHTQLTKFWFIKFRIKPFS